MTTATTTPRARVTASARMRSTLSCLLPELLRVSTQFWEHPDLPVIYPRYLAAMHTVIRASVPLMQDALEVTRERYLDEPCGRPLAAYLDKHIGEEMRHDDWLLEDLERLGVPRQAAVKHVPSLAVTAMVGAQYYYIRHVHPAVFLGYIAVLEGYPPSESQAAVAARHTGYPITAFRTLRKHAHLDPAHRQDLYRAIDSVPLDDTLHGLARANGLQTLNYLITLIGEITGDALSSRLEHGLA
jgi:hypothetical protein